MPLMSSQAFQSSRGLRPNFSSSLQALLDRHSELYEQLQGLYRPKSEHAETDTTLEPAVQYHTADELRKELDANVGAQAATRYIDAYNAEIDKHHLSSSYQYASTTAEVDATLFGMRTGALDAVKDTEGRAWRNLPTPNVKIWAVFGVEWRPKSGESLFSGFVRDVRYSVHGEELEWLDSENINLVIQWREAHGPSTGAGEAMIEYALRFAGKLTLLTGSSPPHSQISLGTPI